MTTEKLILLIVLLFTHWLADYTHLSRPWMLAAKRLGKPVLPIVAHAGVHALLVYLIALIVASLEVAIILGLFQWISHALIDIWKGRMNVWFPSLRNPANVYHWYVFGIDQFFHLSIIALTVYLI